MPEMTGPEATQEIRRMESQGLLSTFVGALPIVGMSAMTKKFTREEYTEMGMDDFLQWPVDRSVVTELMASCMNRSAAHRPPVVDVNLVLELCDGEYPTTISMLDEFVRTSLLQLGMLRNGLIADQEDKLHASLDAIVSAAKRFGAPWVSRACSEFARLLPGAPADAPRDKKRAQKVRPQKLHSQRLRALTFLEEEIVRIGDAVAKIRDALQPQDDVHGNSLVTITEAEEGCSHNGPGSASSSIGDAVAEARAATAQRRWVREGE